MLTNLERAALAVLGCVAMATALVGCGSTTTTTTSVTTTTPDAGGSSSGGSNSGGPTSGGGSTSGASTTYTVAGTVSGLGANESVTLLNNGGDAVNVSSDGAFTFSTQLAAGADYSVTLQQHTPGIACSITEGSGTVASSNVSGVAVSCGAGKETVLYSFAGGASGAVPLAAVVMDSAGNLYGTTQQGGESGHGTVFKISGSGAQTILHSFGGSKDDGEDPQSTLVMDSAGNLYGTTPRGGAHGGGTIFEIAATGSETILHSFGTGPDGQTPDAGLIMDSAGDFYGTTRQGGTFGAGTVFELSAAGNETILHSFVALGMASDGQNPQGALVMDGAGNLYGTTSYGGENMGGIVFEVSQGKETVLYSFGSASPSDGRIPYAGLIIDSGGNLHGTTTLGGANNDEGGGGAAFALSPSGKETALYSFGVAQTDGRNPYGSLVMDGDGNLFGTTKAGGASGAGTVFKLSADGKETVLYSFGANGKSDGSAPHAALLIDGAGNLYGTTAGGGAHGSGTVFKID